MINLLQLFDKEVDQSALDDGIVLCDKYEVTAIYSYLVSLPSLIVPERIEDWSIEIKVKTGPASSQQRIAWDKFCLTFTTRILSQLED